MPQRLFIAEKPSLGRAIAENLASLNGSSINRQDGYLQIGDDIVTWVFGHVYELAMPEEYDPALKRWSLSTLPIIPEKWKMNVRKDAAKQVGVIQGLLKRSDIIVNTGDAGREGQILIDEVLTANNLDPFDDCVLRCWVTSYAEKDMKKALQGLFQNAEKRGLSEAAKCRMHADFLHGINLTRLYSILARNAGSDALVSVGRVQTPTLKLVVDRDREIEKFKPTDHYLPTGLFVHENGKFKATWVIPDDHDGVDIEGRLTDKNVAQQVLNRIAGKNAQIRDYQAKEKHKQPPLPFSLSKLQTACSSKFGLTAKQTLEVAQSLYEKHKIATYPRTDSQHLPTAVLRDEAGPILDALAEVDHYNSAVSNSNRSLKSAAWDDKKISDHHGIIPTTDFRANKLRELNEIEGKVFDLIAKHFIAQFYPAARNLSQSATAVVEQDQFKARGNRPIDPGWKTVFGAEWQEEEEGDDDEPQEGLPDMKKGDPAQVESTEVQSKRTKPPARFTDGTLIGAMAAIHKFVDDPQLRKRLRENEGLGTEATRADIIETLIKRNFLKRKGKKQIISTEFGRSVVDQVPRAVSEPGLTALWESFLDAIAKNEQDPQVFMEKTIETIRKRIAEGQNKAMELKGVKGSGALEGTGSTCPSCEQGTLTTRVVRKGDKKGQKFLSCDRYDPNDKNSCNYTWWPDNSKNVKPLEGDGKACPKCQKGKMVTRAVRKGDKKGQRFLACDNFDKNNMENSCRHTEWPDSSGESLSSRKRGGFGSRRKAAASV